MIWVLLILGLSSADKLDRTYLPPPGSKFSGGSPDAIQLPFEDSKSQYPGIAIGIDRVPPKRPLDTYQDTYSSINNPPKYPGSTLIASTTTSAFPKNTAFSSNDRYSTISPVHSSNDFNDFQNSDNPTNFYHPHNQLQETSDSNENQFRTTENYPQLFQENIPVSDINRKDFSYDILSNQSKPHGEGNDGIVDSIYHSSPAPQLVTHFLSNQHHDPGKYSSSSTPTEHANNNLVSSTTSPSTQNYNFVEPKQFYSSTLKPSQFFTASTLGSPVYNSVNIKKRPERIQAQADREASILNYESSISPEGYAYTYDTSNGIHADESGVTLNGVKAKGSYSYIGDDGKLYNVAYTADEYGFQPRGDHLPTSPPIPDAILKVIEQVSKEKEAGIFDDGSYDENKYGYKKYHHRFYSPKTYLSNVNPIVNEEGKLIKNTNQNRGVIRNQIGNKNDKQPNLYQNYIANNSSSPVIHAYANSDNNYQNVGSNFPLQPYEFHNKSGIKHVGSYDDTDLETGDETNNGSSSDSFKQTYKHPIIDDERRQLLDKQTPNDKIGTYNDFIVGLGEGNKPNEYNNEEYYTETGYQYNPPQYSKNNKFPSRFSDNYNVKHEIPKQGNDNEITPKPFLTPYVSRNDEKQKYDNYGRPLKNPESDFEEELTRNNNNYPLYSEDDLNDKGAYNRTVFSKIPNDNIPFKTNYQIDETNVGDHDSEIKNDGYSYKQVLNSDKKSFDPFIAAPHSYTSTVVPTEFTSRISTSQSKNPKYSAGNRPTTARQQSIIPSTTYLPYVYETNIQLNKTNSLPDYSTITPGFNDQYGNVPSETKIGQQKSELKNTTPITEFSTIIPIIGNSYAPNLDITNTDEYNVQPTTEKIIGEDFSGPKQPQRFDPRTGYHY